MKEFFEEEEERGWQTTGFKSKAPYEQGRNDKHLRGRGGREGKR